MAANQPTLPQERAFVVQVRSDVPGTREALRGRVEHIASGESANFDSVEGLLDFIVGLLGDGTVRSR
jgi:hypothetical protein